MSGQLVAPHQAPHAPKRSNDNPIAGGTGKLSYFIGSFVIHVTQSCWKEKIQYLSFVHIHLSWLRQH